MLSRPQEARRVLNAEYQHIVYNEFLPALLGQQYMENFGLLPLTDGYSNDYRDDFVSLTCPKFWSFNSCKMICIRQDPRVTNEFSTAGYRVGHTLIPRIVEMYSTINQRLQVISRTGVLFDMSYAGILLQKSQRLRDSFFNVDILRDDRGVDELLTGLTLTPVQRADNNFADDVREEYRYARKYVG